MINIFFVIFMTITTFLIFISYDASLWHICPKSGIFKVFFQNIRFNLSVAGYFNAPVFISLIIFLTFRPAHITKFFAGIIRSYYLSAFIASFSLLTLSFLIKNIKSIEKIMSTEYFSKLSIIYSAFDNPTFVTMLIIMSALFLITVIFFALFFKMILKAEEYTIDDYQQAMVATVLALLLCVFFAKGKVIGHLTVRDAAVTPVIQLNDYAVAGPYKIFNDLKKLNLSDISVIKNKRAALEENNMIITDDDEEKARQLLYRFTPKAINN
ncbi:MAG: hypothetical protein FWG57_02005 [Endomicrobia bacterium]|nr:hypothetical protein [Endomicrobiia bacterium]